ncbi:PA0069 family radical SAM protein [Pusillimonas sp. TS35]|uniref:PA0069 family radical SAM protein n=1 Tax=Paracandidimonas lactea TaxID=2895524 RepID=UPI0013704F17|nr:PA0069 family radical SAM protein [Paracandidimonas lactea]MYN13052.1 PA0069 family radical SAM protein [Pusillimonas sp. TS35]
MNLAPLKGRGSLSNRSSRFDTHTREAVDDGWPVEPDDSSGAPGRPPTTVTSELARGIISHNDSPDIPFDQSVNVYRGCEHGCIYCYARPSHAYLNLSPGLDFETKLFAKTNAAQVLRASLSRPAYQPQVIAMGTNTDPYQPIERRLRLTAEVLDVLEAFGHPFTITTKSAAVTRDLDLLARMARRRLVRVFMSIGTLDRHIARTLEPRASTPMARMEAVRALSQAGVPTGVLVSPLIPALSDHDLETIVSLAGQAGALDAHYTVLRLPREVAGLFEEWLQAHYPLKAAHVMNLLREMRGGKVYDANFATRMRGTGIYADLLRQRFRRACARAGLNERRIDLDLSQFHRPAPASPQLDLF